MRMHKLKQVTGFVIAVVIGTCLVVSFLRVSVFSHGRHASLSQSEPARLTELGSALFQQNWQRATFSTGLM